MARITVEDCLDKVENRFELVLLAAKRARQIASGSEARVELENDKPTVVALREIAENKIDARSVAELEELEKQAEAAEAVARELAEAQAEADGFKTPFPR